MLKLTIKQSDGERLVGQVIVDARGLPGLVQATPPGDGHENFWHVWTPFEVGQMDIGYPHRAASLLHALELGIAAAARWIAVELLKDPAPPPVGEERIYGVGLMLLPSVQGLKLRMGRDLQATDLGYVNIATSASKEQALAELIEHAAPWIAAALAKEIEP